MSNNKYMHICDYCGKEHYLSSTQRLRIKNGKQDKCFCSRECSNLYKKKDNYYKCDYCGKELYKTKSQIANTSNNFCSHECADKFRSEKHRKNVVCEICGKSFNIKKSQNQRFCSIECQGKWQSTQVGQLNPRYMRKTIKCDWCGLEFDEKRHKINDFDNHFCSTKCRQEWYANVWSQREEWKTKARKNALKMLSEGAFENTDSKPQLTLNTILENNNIIFEREKINDFYAYDNYLLESGLIIEVQGDYWHCNPLIYRDMIYKSQANRIKCDKAKHTYTKKEYGVEILYLWECDLVSNIELCNKLVIEYISKCGILKNYNSFNYHLEDGNLLINDSIVLSYQERKFDEYKNIIREKVS